MKPITNPKVFVSYAWGTDTYQQKVLDFCTRLYTECGIEVVVDKWSMDAGNDTYDFMERSAKDPSVHFVIMLLDKNYAEKADARQGGVGTETQIISPKVYADTKQTKFVPVVFERDDGKVYKPEYLEGRLHFDLTKVNANDEFIRLVKHLYGEKTYPIPQTKGTKPDWVSQPMVMPPVAAGPLLAINNTTDDAVIKSEAKRALRSIRDDVFSFNPTDEEVARFQTEPQSYLDYLTRFRPYRDAIITMLEKIKNKDYFTYIAADFFEEFRISHDDRIGVHAFIAQLTGAFLHEIFIYTIAFLWEAEEYGKIYDLTSHTYFLGGRHHFGKTGRFTDVVYSGGHVNLIENAKNKNDGKNYYSGLAQLWSEHIMTGYTLEQVVFADLLLYNLTVLEEPEGVWYWFPMLYVYGIENQMFVRFALRFKSKHQIERFGKLFGSPASIDEKMKKMVTLSGKDKYRYNAAFDKAPLILDHVKADEIGKLP